jgi:hypothetical protein
MDRVSDALKKMGPPMDLAPGGDTLMEPPEERLPELVSPPAEVHELQAARDALAARLYQRPEAAA